MGQAFTAVVAEATQVGDQLSVVVQKSDGVTITMSPRYTVSLFDPNAKASLEAQVRPSTKDANITVLKANLQLIVKGLALDLTDPAATSPDPALVTFLANLATLRQVTRASADGLTVDSVDAPGLRAAVQKALGDHAAWAAYL